jgi:rSAM/selenodomain-associated transferase 1
MVGPPTYPAPIQQIFIIERWYIKSTVRQGNFPTSEHSHIRTHLAVSPFSNPKTAPAILLFLKAPRRGYVKTRLAHTTGPERALQAYRALVQRQWDQLPENGRIEVHYTPSDADFEMRQWLGNEHEFYPQAEGELGLRLEHSVEKAFGRGAKTVFCIGGDCPKLDRSHFEQAAAALKHDCDVVFGPSEDGGYYLIGLNAPQPELFQEIPWSSRNTLSTSL